MLSDFPNNIRIALVHDWLTVYAGAERVLEQMLNIFPDADLFSLIDFIPAGQRGFIRNKSVTTSFIQKLPKAKTHYRSYLPLMPAAVERFDLSNYDLVLSSSHAVAKGVITRPDQLHICYLQARNLKYAYEDRLLYPSGKALSLLQDIYLSYIRVWDSVASQRPDVTIANSKYVRDWHLHRHACPSAVIYPPVDTFTFGNKFCENKEKYFVAVGRIEPYKRFDLIVEAFNQLGYPLRIIGDGTQKKSLQQSSADNIEWLGFQNTPVIAEVVSRARSFLFASREDFGIAPLEAQACGTPVIAFGKGGALETVQGLDSDQPSGVFFLEQTVHSICEAINQFELNQSRILPAVCRNNALKFAPERFRLEFTEFVEKLFIEFKGTQVASVNG